MIRARAWLLVLAASLLLVAACATTTPRLSESDVEDEMYRLVNEQREQAGLLALARDDYLDELAGRYSESGFSETLEESSDIKYLLCNSWWVTYGNGVVTLQENTAAKQVDYCLENENLRDAMLRSDATATGLGVAVAGDTAYYSQLFDVLNAAGGGGEAVRLYENPIASDPSWELLKSFVAADDTDEKPYVPESFVCADFAAMLHNRAEESGIRAAYVAVDFLDGPGHALNAFNTADRGLVFIDCTGKGLNTAIPGAALDGQQITWDYDKVAYLAQGQPYGLISLDRAPAFGYDSYRQWTRQWETYDTTAATYEQKAAEYDEALGGRTVITDPEEFAQLKAMYEELEALKEDLQSLRAALGEYRWETLGTVSQYYVHW